MAGRSVPDEQEILPAALGIPLEPSVLVSRWGDIIILKKAADAFHFEDLARGLAVASGGVSCVRIDVRSRCQAHHDLRGFDPVDFARTHGAGSGGPKSGSGSCRPEAGHGYRLFHGVVAECNTRGDRGFTWSLVKLEGVKEDAGHTYRIRNKHENIVTWYDGKVDATPPEIMTQLRRRAHGTRLGRVSHTRRGHYGGFPNDPRWRTPKGIEYFGPRHEGFDFDYVPIEQLQKVRNNPQVE